MHTSTEQHDCYRYKIFVLWSSTSRGRGQRISHVSRVIPLLSTWLVPVTGCILLQRDGFYLAYLHLTPYTPVVTETRHSALFCRVLSSLAADGLAGLPGRFLGGFDKRTTMNDARACRRVVRLGSLL